MGLLSAIAGPLVGAVASGILGNKQRKDARSDAKAKFTDLRASAEKAGFNPLTALMATGGSGFGDYGPSIPPLATSQFLSEAASSVAREMTGEAAVARATERANLEMAKMSLESMRSGVASVGGTQNPLAVANPTKVFVEGPQTVSQPRLSTSKPQVQDTVDGWEVSEKEAVRDVPLTSEFRTGRDGDESYRSLNPDAFEIGVGELIGGGLVHATAWALPKLVQLNEKLNAPRADMVYRRKTQVPYSAAKNPPLRGYYGPPGSRTGF